MAPSGVQNIQTSFVPTVVQNIQTSSNPITAVQNVQPVVLRPIEFSTIPNNVKTTIINLSSRDIPVMPTIDQVTSLKESVCDNPSAASDDPIVEKVVEKCPILKELLGQDLYKVRRLVKL